MTASHDLLRTKDWPSLLNFKGLGNMDGGVMCSEAVVTSTFTFPFSSRFNPKRRTISTFVR